MINNTQLNSIMTTQKAYSANNITDNNKNSDSKQQQVAKSDKRDLYVPTQKFDVAGSSGIYSASSLNMVAPSTNIAEESASYGTESIEVATLSLMSVDEEDAVAVMSDVVAEEDVEVDGTVTEGVETDDEVSTENVEPEEEVEVEDTTDDSTSDDSTSVDINQLKLNMMNSQTSLMYMMLGFNSSTSDYVTNDFDAIFNTELTMETILDYENQITAGQSYGALLSISEQLEEA